MISSGNRGKIYVLGKRRGTREEEKTWEAVKGEHLVWGGINLLQKVEDAQMQQKEDWTKMGLYSEGLETGRS